MYSTYSFFDSSVPVHGGGLAASSSRPPSAVRRYSVTGKPSGRKPSSYPTARTLSSPSTAAGSGVAGSPSSSSRNGTAYALASNRLPWWKTFV
ncbi:hypothetical protein ACWER9_13270 [Micromonospora sp. NPDC003944]